MEVDCGVCLFVVRMRQTPLIAAVDISRGIGSLASGGFAPATRRAAAFWRATMDLRWRFFPAIIESSQEFQATLLFVLVPGPLEGFFGGRNAISLRGGTASGNTSVVSETSFMWAWPAARGPSPAQPSRTAASPETR